MTEFNLNDKECLKRVRYNMLCKDARSIEDKCKECRDKLVGEKLNGENKK